MAPRVSPAREPQAPALGAPAPERFGRRRGRGAAGAGAETGSATATGLGRAAPKEGAATAECASTRSWEMAAMLGALEPYM